MSFFGLDIFKFSAPLAVRHTLHIRNIYFTEKICTILFRNLIFNFSCLQALESETFGNLSRECVREIISRDSFCAPEVEIFKAVYNWVRINDITNDECENILKEVRLTLIPTQDLLKVVRPTNLIQPDVLLDAIQSRTESRDMELKYRGYLSEFFNIVINMRGKYQTGKINK